MLRGNKEAPVKRLIPVLALLLMAACAQIPPTPEELEAKQFRTIPDKAVIYLVRSAFGPGWAAPVVLDESPIGTTYRRTFIRIETRPGKHEFRGYAGDSGSISLTTEAGKLYFIEQDTYDYRSFVRSAFGIVDAERGMTLVRNAELHTIVQQ